MKTGGKKDEKKTVLYTTKAYNSFLYNLRKLYPKKKEEQHDNGCDP